MKITSWLCLLLAGCADPGPRASFAEEVGVLEQSELLQGRDGGGSARAFGASVWVYGDTVLDVPDVDGRNWHHNSVSYTLDGDAADGITGFVEPLDEAGAPAHLIPPSPDEKAFNDAHYGDDCDEEPCGARWAVWPGAPLWDEANQRGLIFYGLIYAEPGDFNFGGVGQSIATWSALDAPVQRPVVDPAAEHPDLIWGPDEPDFGTAAAIADSHLYAYGCDGGGWANPCRLARAPLDAVQDRAAWRYWDGRDWQPDLRRAKGLFDGAPILEISFVEYLDAWLAVYSHPFSDDIVARTAPALTGPWSREQVLYTTPGDAPYDALNHPDFAEDGGRVQYITYSRHTTGWFGTEFPVVRVELQ